MRREIYWEIKTGRLHVFSSGINWCGYYTQTQYSITFFLFTTRTARFLDVNRFWYIDISDMYVGWGHPLHPIFLILILIFLLIKEKRSLLLKTLAIVGPMQLSYQTHIALLIAYTRRNFSFPFGKCWLYIMEGRE